MIELNDEIQTTLFPIQQIGKIKYLSTVLTNLPKKVVSILGTYKGQEVDLTLIDDPVLTMGKSAVILTFHNPSTGRQDPLLVKKWRRFKPTELFSGNALKNWEDADGYEWALYYGASGEYTLNCSQGDDTDLNLFF